MILTLRRIARKPQYTIGKLYIDGTYFCDTLEDTDRGLTQSMSLIEISKRKIHGATAIPTGTYSVQLNVRSPKYSNFARYPYAKISNGYMPRLFNVKGYTGVLIHAGNTHRDTEGCILVGKNKEVGKVLESQATWTELYKKMKQASSITLIVK